MKSKRLLEITQLVGKNSIVADIGTDHGYIPVYLIENGISKKVIGSDISKGSLSKIVDYVRQRKLEDKIDTRLGNGLEVLRPFEVDTLIIAGMGGILIRDILDNSKAVTNSIVDFILQPMIGAEELRKYLINNGFKIVEERLLKEDGKYYEIIHCRHGKEKVEDDIYYEFSQELIASNFPLMKEYIEFKLKDLSKIAENIRSTKSDKVEERLGELEHRIKKYEEVLEKIDS